MPFSPLFSIIVVPLRVVLLLLSFFCLLPFSLLLLHLLLLLPLYLLLLNRAGATFER